MLKTRLTLIRVLYSIVLTIATSFLPNLQASIIEPTYSLINPFKFNEAGWPNDSYMVAPIIHQLNAKVIIEVGSWLGASSRVIAGSLPEDAVMICVDHWLGSPEHHFILNYNTTFFDSLFPQFLSNTFLKGFSNKLLPLRISSLDAANLIDIQADLIYLDASHETDAVYADLQAWWPKLRDGGVLCGDDWMWLSVRTAIKQFAQENGLTVHARSDDNAFWYFDPKNKRKMLRRLSPKPLIMPSIYSLIREIKFQENFQENLTNQLLESITNFQPNSIVLVEPKETVSICSIGSVMKNFGNLFLIESFEFFGNNLYPNYTTHPFHQRLSNIKQASLTNTIIPIQMFSMQAAQFSNILSPMIFINLEEYLENALDHLTIWKNHLADDGILCGNLGNTGELHKALETFALSYGFVYEIKDSGFWMIHRKAID